MNATGLMKFMGSLFAGVVVGLGVVSNDGPPWAVSGFGTLAALLCMMWVNMPTMERKGGEE